VTVTCQVQGTKANVASARVTSGKQTRSASVTRRGSALKVVARGVRARRGQKITVTLRLRDAAPLRLAVKLG
jgi:hypothetical protein